MASIASCWKQFEPKTIRLSEPRTSVIFELINYNFPYMCNYKFASLTPWLCGPNTRRWGMPTRTRTAILSLVPSPNSPLHMPESIETEDSFRPGGLRIPTIQIPVAVISSWMEPHIPSMLDPNIFLVIYPKVKQVMPGAFQRHDRA